MVLMSHNGLQFDFTPFKDFASECGFIHMTSNLRYPQANGEAEQAVATLKGLWKEGEHYAKVLLSKRATHFKRSSGLSLFVGKKNMNI